MDSSPLLFAAPALADKPRVRELVQHAMGSDLAFANIYLLQEKYKTTIAFAEGFFFRYFEGSNRLTGYAFPCGQGDIQAALKLIQRDAAARKRDVTFCLLTQEQRSLLEELYPGTFCYKTDRGDADYLYTQTQLADLPGASYHSKRNHIAQFVRSYPDWQFLPVTGQRTQDALYIARKWMEAMDSASPALLHELRAIEKALHHYDELDLFGGILYVEGQPIAMSIGSYISPKVADIHYEKCLPEWKRAYPLINREMARYLNHCEFINREEDLNQAGLRQAKLSYHPALILEKYTATSPALC